MYYQVIVAWEDCACKTENYATLAEAMGAAESYLKDPDMPFIAVYSWITRKNIIEIDTAKEHN